jgi:hypothetical protein
MYRSKLIKFLNLSNSPNESEAISAIRKAHTLLKENDLNWKELIEESTTKELKEDNAILNMNFLKERAYSQELKDGIRNLKKFTKYLIFFIFVLLIIIVYINIT